jgi:flavodoxin
MKTIIVYDSNYGNTKKVAEIIKKELKKDVSIIFVDDFNNEMLNGTDLLIVGSPTIAFGPTKKIKKFLKSLDNKDLINKKVAAFDTRMDIKKIDNKFLTFMEKRFGYAKGKIEKSLLKKGAALYMKSEGFYVDTDKGPLSAKEEEKIKEWIKIK